MPRAIPALSRVCLLTALAVVACRPDPYALFLRTIDPGEEVALPGGRTLVAREREGGVLRDVTITGPAETCEGTMELEAREVRVERGEGGTGTLLVLEGPVARELCGATVATTRHDRLVIHLDDLGR
jgi:hypothetical protein